MGAVNIREARERLGALVDAAQHRESVTITRRGKEVARLVPIEPQGGRSLPDLSEFRASIQVRGKPLSQMVRALRDEERF